MSGTALLGVMLGTCEKANELARICREGSVFEATMINTKPDRVKGDDRESDAVTLADVLIQKMIQFDLERAYPVMKGSVMGEEAGVFYNSNGEAVEVRVQSTVAETANLLTKLLGDSGRNRPICEQLANIVHRQLPQITPQRLGMPTPDGIVVDPTDLGVWIDPLDSTASYIRGRMAGVSGNTIQDESGALCTTTVLVGAFQKSTGKPICGVVGQPFARPDDAIVTGWSSRIFWGLLDPSQPAGSGKWGAVPAANPNDAKNAPDGILTIHSKSEGAAQIGAMAKIGSTQKVSGAGFKLLCVSRHLATVFCLTMPSAYPWDTCGPQAILEAMGGSVVDPTTGVGLTYAVDNPDAHKNGLVATFVPAVAGKLVEELNALPPC